MASGTARCWRLGQPREKPLERPAVDDSLGWNGGKPGMRDRGVSVGELCRRVRVAIEGKETPRCQRPRCQRMIDILASGIAVDFDRDAPPRRRGEHLVP